MKPEIKKSFDLIVQVTGLFQGNREQHLQIQEALKTIEAGLTPTPPENIDKK